MDELTDVTSDLVQLTRLALSGNSADVRLFAARLVRKYRAQRPELARELEIHLKARPERGLSPLREAATAALDSRQGPTDAESRLSLLRLDTTPRADVTPILPGKLQAVLTQLVTERLNADKLAARGLTPPRSAIFVGPPGVGKTMSARWVARQLGLPLFVLDLAAVISSYLGKSGSNVRSAFDHARGVPCVLLLDEIDAIAKKRSDEADVGELKRLVTVIMQEVDEWPATGLLLAATNHQELIDPALWRRFDLVLEFSLPSQSEIIAAIERFAGNDRGELATLAPALAAAFEGLSLSDVERAVRRVRRSIALGRLEPADVLEEVVASHSERSRGARIKLAIALAETGTLSDHRVSQLTRVSRDTIRKHVKRSNKEVR